MATILNETLCGLDAVKKNAEALKSHEDSKDRPVIFSTCPIHDGDTVTIMDKPDELVGSYRNNGGPWRDGLRVKVNGKDEVITPTLLTKIRSTIDGVAHHVNGDLNAAFESLKGINRKDFNAGLASKFAGDYVATVTTVMTIKTRYQDGVRYISPENFYSLNLKK